MKRSILYSILLLLFCPALLAQNTIAGIILDEESMQAVELVNVIILENYQGTISASDGSFILNTALDKGQLELKAIGFKPLYLDFKIKNGRADLGNVYLQRIIIPLDEITITSGLVKDDVDAVAVSTISARTIQNELGDRPLPFSFLNTPAVYSFRSGGGSGDAEMSIRGFNQENVGVLLNGVPINGVENGLVYWSNWLGLSNTAAEIQIQKGPGVANAAINAVGGTINIVTEPAARDKGGSLLYEITSYGNQKITVSLNSGRLKNGWSISFMGSYMHGPGYIDATYVRGMSYFLAMSKQINEKNKFTLTLMGAPQRHGQRTLRLSEEEHNLRGNKFNKDWGSLNGKINNASENFYHRPYLGLSHYLSIDQNKTLATTAYLIMGSGGGKWSESFNYAPTIFYYRNPTGQIDWPAIVENNATHDGQYVLADGDTVNGYSLNVQTDFLASHVQAGILSTYEQHVTKNLKLVTGIHYRYFQAFLREQITDLLGGGFFIEDYSWAADGVSGRNQVKTVGDIIKVNNRSIINFANAYAQLIFSGNPLKAFISANGNSNWYQRIDNYNYINDTKSELVVKPGYDFRAGLSYHPANNHTIYLNAAYISRAPYFKFVFGNFTNVPVYNLENEEISTIEAGYRFENQMWTINVNGFYTNWNNVSLLSDEYVQLESNLQSRAMINGLRALHQGIEAEISVRIDPRVRLGAFGLLGDYRWKNDVVATLYNNDNVAVDTVNVFVRDIFVGGNAQQQLGIYGDFRILDFFNFRAEWLLNDKMFASFNPTFRNNSEDRLQAYRIPSYSILNIHLGIPFKFFNSAGRIQINAYNLTNSIHVEWGEDGMDHDLDTFTGFWSFGRNFDFMLRLNF